MSTGFVVDVCATSDSIFAIQERLPFPGVDRPYTYVVEAPLSGLNVGPDRPYRCRITIDTAARTVQWEVDAVTVFEASVAEPPHSVKLGLGMFTLHPTVGGSSRSLHGQGLSGLWRNVGTNAAAAKRRRLQISLAPGGDRDRFWIRPSIRLGVAALSVAG